jgi:hypothetical protein
MNLPGHRIAACLGKAALKPHALQTLRDRRASPNRAKRLECVRFIGAFRPARDLQRFMAATHDFRIVETLHPLQSAAGILPADRSEESTAGQMPAAPSRCRLINWRFMLPMHVQKRKEAFHERLYWTPWKVCGRNERAWMMRGDAGAFFIYASPSSAAL